MAISYELAKELKDAGFPQKGKFAFQVRGHMARKDGSPFYVKDQDRLVQTGLIVAPTLSELMEACPHTFHGRGVFTLSSSNGGNLWLAHYISYLPPITVDDEYRGQGETSSEAVARLWLALNRK